MNTKKLTSLLLATSLMLSLATPAVAAKQTLTDTAEPGFTDTTINTVTKSAYDVEYDIDTESVTINAPGSYLITGSGKPTENNITISAAKNSDITVTLSNVNIDLREVNPEDKATSPFTTSPGNNVTLILADGTDNMLFAGVGSDGLQASTITITGNGKLTTQGGDHEWNWYHGINGNVHITGNATVTATGGMTSSGYYGGDGISSKHGDILIDGYANITATGRQGGAGIGGGYNNNTVTIKGDATVNASADMGSGIGGSGGNYGNGEQNPAIFISENAVVNASGGGYCNEHGQGYYVYAIGAGCDTTNAVTISGNAVVTAYSIGGSYDSYVTVSDNAKVIGNIESKFNFSNMDNSGYDSDCGGRISITGDAKITGNISAAQVIALGTTIINGDIYCGTNYSNENGNAAPAGEVTLNGNAHTTGSVTAETLTMSDKAMVSGNIGNCTNIELNDTAMIITNKPKDVALPATTTPRVTPLIAIDCGPSLTERTVLLNNGTNTFAFSLPAEYRGFLGAVPAGDYTITRDGYSYKDKDENDSFAVVLTDDAINTIFVSCPRTTMAFETGTNTRIESQQADIGTAFVEPSLPKIAGYDFDGWYANADRTVQLHFPVDASTDTTAYAKLTPRTDTKYTVKHVQQDKYGDNYTNRETETFTGTTGSVVTAQVKNYIGFLPNGELSAAIEPNGSTIIIVKYDRITHDVNLIIDKDTSIPAQPVRNNAYPDKNDPEKAGHTFGGWYADDTYQELIKYSFSKTIYNTWQSGDEITTHAISTAADWNSFVDYVNNGGETEGHLFQLDRDINFKNAIIPTVKTVFKGVFNANNFTMSSFEIQAPLFESIGKDAQIKFLNIERGKLNVINTDDKPIAIGIVVGANHGIVSDIAIERSSYIVVSRKGNYETQFGSIIGANYGTLQASYIYYRGYSDGIQMLSKFPSGSKPTKLQQGGLVGYNNGTISDCYASLSTSTTIGSQSTGNAGYYAAITGLNDIDGTIQNTYWSFAYIFDSSSVSLASYRQKMDDNSIVTVSHEPFYMNHNYENGQLSNNDNYVMSENHLKLTSAQNAGITQDTTLYAKLTPRNNTPYIIEHYGQNINDDSYTLMTSESKFGVTGATANAEANTYSGFTESTQHPDRISSGVITGDGSLKLALYYDRTKHSIHFNTNGGNNIESITGIKYGSVVTAPTDPIKQGYDFNGWCSDESLTTDVSFATPITVNTTLYAKWTPRGDTAYTVEHYCQNISDDDYTKADTQNLSGETASTVNAAPKTYVGFHENKTHAENIISGKISHDGTLVLKLYYDRDVHTVTFDSGDATDTQSVRFMGTATKPEDPTRAGYNFKGWFTGDATIAYDFNTPVETPITLTAKWEQIPSSSSSGTTLYKITVKHNDGGSVTPGTISVKRNKSQTFAITPDDGFIIKELSIDGKSVAVTSDYTFEKVTAAHTLDVIFEKSTHTCPSEPFIDVDVTKWYHTAIDTAIISGLMHGVSVTKFAPDGKLTRGEFATILARMSNDKLTNGTASRFTDVIPTDWYAPAVEWAFMTNTMLGDGAGHAMPAKIITREQFVTMLYRYDKAHAVNTNALDTFIDTKSISTWAKNALAWAVENELVNGTTETTIAPFAEITRAECAAIIARYFEFKK